MTHCTIGAMIVNHLIMERSNSWTSIYNPQRTIIRGISDFVSEQTNTLAQYSDWLKGGEVATINDIPLGQSAIVQIGVRKIAVFKDEQGRLHPLSPKCSHLGCIVHFNSAERS